MRVELSRNTTPPPATQPVYGLTIEDYEQVLTDLLPRGWAWTREPEAVLMRTFAGLAAEFARVTWRDCNLLDEAYPGTSVETLTDWERICGLPNACTGPLESVGERRHAVLMQLASRGGQSRAYYIRVAAALGYPITITEYLTFRAGQNRAGDGCNGIEWAYTWKINASTWAMRSFRAGQNQAGQALRSFGNRVLECTMNELKPAHTVLLFGYYGSMWDGGGSHWDDGHTLWDRDLAPSQQPEGDGAVQPD